MNTAEKILYMPSRKNAANKKCAQPELAEFIKQIIEILDAEVKTCEDKTNLQICEEIKLLCRQETQQGKALEFETISKAFNLVNKSEPELAGIRRNVLDIAITCGKIAEAIESIIY